MFLDMPSFLRLPNHCAQGILGVLIVTALAAAALLVVTTTITIVVINIAVAVVLFIFHVVLLDQGLMDLCRG